MMHYTHRTGGPSEASSSRLRFRRLGHALLAATVGAATLALMPPSLDAIEVPPIGEPYFFQTSGPQAGLGIGDFYTSVDGDNTDHQIRIQIPCGLPAYQNVIVDLFDPEIGGTSALAPDEDRNGADDATFTLTSPASTVLQTTTYAGGTTATNNQWVPFFTIDPSASGTGCGEYFLNIFTGNPNGTGPVNQNNDDNSYRIRAVFDTNGNTTNDAGDLDDIDGVSGTGDEIVLAYDRTSIQHSSNTTSHFYFFVDTSLVGTEIRLHNFDLDNAGTITYIKPDGSTFAGTPSIPTGWNGPGASTGSPPARVGDAYTVTAADVGWWRTDITVGANNQFIFEGVTGLPIIPSGPTSPPSFGQPEINITKDDALTTVSNGEQITYDIVIENDSFGNTTPNAGPAYNIEIVDTLPAGLSYVGCTNPNGGCSQTGPNEVRYTFDNTFLPQAANGTDPAPSFTVTLTADVIAVDPGPLTNSATVTFDDAFGLTLAPETATDTDTVLAAVDLSIVKSDADVTATPGGSVVYDLTYDQLGTRDLTGVTITETVPDNSTFDSGASTAGWVCTPGNVAGSNCTLAVGAVAAADGPATVQFAVTVDNPYATGAPDLSNTASIADDGTIAADSDPTNNTDTEPTPVDAAPDLVVTKVDTPSAAVPLSAGDTISYTVSVLNDGTTDSTLTTITDTPSGTVSIDVGSGSVSQGGITSINSTTVTADFGTIAPGQTATLTYVVTVDALQPGQNTVVNQATVTNGEGDSVLSDDPSVGGTTDPNVVTLDTTSDLTVTKVSDAVGPVEPGDIITYTVTATNSGTTTLTNLTATDPPPPGTAAVPGGADVDGPVAYHDFFSNNYTGGQGWTGPWIEVDDGGGASNGGTTCGPNGSDVCVISDGGSNRLRIENDDNGGYREVDLTNATSADLSFLYRRLATLDQVVTVHAKTGSVPTNAAKGTQIFVVDGTSPTAYTQQTVNLDAFVGNVVYIGFFGDTTGSDDDAALFDDILVSADRPSTDAPTLTSTPVLPAGESVDYTIEVTVDGPLDAGVTSIFNQVTVNSDQTSAQVADVSDPVVAPTVTSTKTDNVALASDLSPGNTITYTVEVNNTSAVSATNVVFTDTPGANTTLIGNVTTTQGSIIDGNGTGDTDVAVTIGTIAPNSTVTITFDATIDTPFPTGVTTVQNQGLVVGDRFTDVSTDDPETVTAGDPTITNITAAPAFTLSKTDSLAVPVAPGDTITYTLSATNTGTTAAIDAVIADAAPTGTTFDPSSATIISGPGAIDQGDDPGETTLIVDIASMPVGTTTVVTFRVNVDDPFPAGQSAISNQAAVTADGIGSTPSDDPDDTTGTDDPTVTPVTAAPVLDVTKSASDDPVDPDAELTYTIGYRNTGDQVATGVVLTETVPVNSTFDNTATTAPWNCTPNANENSTCTLPIGDLAPSVAFTEVDFVVTIDATVPTSATQITNTVQIDGDGSLTDSFTTTTDIDALPELLVQKTDAAPGGTLEPGEVVRYSVTIENTGTAAATNVIFTDTPDTNTTLDDGSVTTSQGTVTSGNATLGGGAADTSVAVAVGTIEPGSANAVTITFTATLADPFTDVDGEISNQGLVTGDDSLNVPTDDPAVLGGSTDPTVTPVNAAPLIDVTKSDAFTDTLDPGEPIVYTITVTNAGTGPATNVVVVDDVAAAANITLDAGTVVAVGGTNIIGNDPGDTTVSVTFPVVQVGPANAVTVTFTVDVADPVPFGTTSVQNQANVTGDGGIDVDSDDPDDGTPATDDPTVSPLAAAPDLAVAKNDNIVGSVAPGEPIIYSIRVTNVGDANANSFSLTDTLPEGTSFDSANSPGWTCVGTACSFTGGAVAGSGGFVDVPFAVTVDNPAPSQLTSIDNAVTVATAGDSNTGNNGTTESTPLDAAPILDMTKDDGVGGTVPGETDVYVIRVTNDAAADQTATDIVVSETVPVGTTFNEASSDTWSTCSDGDPAGTTCTFTIASLEPGAAFNIDFAVDVINPAADGLEDIVNTAAIIAEDNLAPADLPAPVTDTNILTAVPDLTIAKTDGDVSVVPGGDVTYTITVTNIGNQASAGSTVTETVPVGSTFVAASPNPWSCTGGEGGSTDCTADLGAIAGGGGTATLDFTVTALSPVAAGQAELDNDVSVVDDGANGPESNTGNNDGGDTTPITANPDLVVTKDDGQASATLSTAGTPTLLTYTITYDNIGTRGATGVVLTETVPVGTTFVSAGSTLGWSGCADGAAASTTCTLNIGTVEVGDAAGTATFVVRVDETVPSGTTTIDNTVTIAASAADPANAGDPVGNNSNSDSDTLDANPDLRPIKSDAAITAVPGGNIAYSITVENIGTEGSAGSTLIETVPDNTTFNDGATTAAWDCASPAAGSVCTLDLGPIAAGATSAAVDFVVTVDATVPTGTTGTTNTVMVTDNGANGADPSGNDSATEPTPINASPTLTATKVDAVAGGGPLAPGGTISYTIVLDNSTGTTGATTVAFNDAVPANTTLVAGTLAAPGGGSIATGSAAADTAVSVTYTVIPAGETRTITFDVIVDAPVPAGVANITNQGTVTAAGGITTQTDDPAVDPGLQDPTTTPLVAAPDLVVTKTDGDASVPWGGNVTYTITYSNVGSQDATGVELTETVPVGTTFVGPTGVGGWTCTPGDTAGTPCTFAIGDLDAGAAAQNIDFTVAVPNPTTETVVANTVTIADDGTNGADEEPGDNADSDTTPILTPPALTITKTGPSQAPATVVEPGDTITYTLAYENNGQTAATGVEIVDVVPVGTRFELTGSDAGWDCADEAPAGTTCTLTLGTVAAGSTGSVDIVVTVLSPAATGFTSVANTATIDDDDTFGADPGPGGVDDTDTFDVAITSGSIGDRIWIDLNEDGAQAGEDGAPVGTVVNLLDQMGDPIRDSNGDPITTTTGVDGAYDFTGLPSGPYRVEVVPPAGYTAFAGATTDRTLPVGGDVDNADIPINGRASIGDKVWIDADGLGDQNETAGLDGVTVRLLDAAGDLVDTDTTTGGGFYAFDDLLPGTYQVELLVASLPASYTLTTAQNSGDIAVGPADVVTTADFGVNAPGSINGTIFVDPNESGNTADLTDETDNGLGGVTVNLLDSGGNPVLDGAGTAITTDTAPDGTYSFTGLLADTYQVSYEAGDLPAGYAPTGAGPTPTNSGDIVVAVNAAETDVDFGANKRGSIGDTVFYDLDGSTGQNGAEPGLVGITVNLLDGLGATIATTTTGAGGAYSFPNLLADDYQVQIIAGDLPANATITTAGGDTQAVTVPVAATPATDVDIDDVDFGARGDVTLGDTVYVDTDGDGTQDPDEQAGVAGVTVELVVGGAVIATDVTDADGAYEFTNVLDGPVTVRIDTATLPTGVAASGASTTDRTVNGVDDDTLDFGVIGTASIGDTVFLDVNGNGGQDAPTDTGQPGVVVTLTDAAGNRVATQTTGAGGAYDFINLPAGTYTVTADPSGLPNGADYSITTTDPLAVTVANDDDIDTADIGINALGTVAGTVFVDLDENGTQVLPAENGQQTVTVSLVDPATGTVLTDNNGNPLTDVTDADGNYLIENVPAGDYEVRVDTTTLPAGSSLVTATPNDTPVTVGPGDDIVDIDFGIIDRGSITGTVFVDPNESGNTADAGETSNGLGGITVNLLDDNGDPVLDGGGTAITTTTDPTDGTYSFTDLPVGAYQVSYDIAGLPTGYTATGAAPAPNNSGDLTVGNGGDLTDVDFGANKRGSIGDTIFYDLDGSTGQNGDEPGLVGVTVNLLDDNGDPVLDGGGAAITATTGAGGFYEFTDLLADDYQVEVDTSTLPAGSAYTTAGGDTQAVTIPIAATPTTDVDDDSIDFGVQGTASIGDQVYLDLDANGTQDATDTTGVGGITVELVYEGDIIATDITDANGNYDFGSLVAGDHTVRIDATTLPTGTSVTTTPAEVTRTLASGDDITDADIGIAGTGSIGDRVWYDADANGADDNSEGGQPGIVVILSDDNGNEIARDTTDAAGAYSFDNLPAGDYVVTVEPTSLPAGSTFTVPPPAAPISLPDGLAGTDNTIDTVDIGITGTRSVGDRVWFDTDGAGDQDASETDGVGGVTVRLFDGTGPTATEITSTTTAPDGSYSFDNIYADTYEVRIDTGTLPGGTIATTATEVAADATTADVDTADFGVTGTNSIGDLVFFDADGNDAEGANEPGLGGVTLRLLDDNGDPVQRDGADVTAVTGPDGNYSFDRLPNGTYSVEVISGLPTGATADNLGTATVVLSGGTDIDTQDFAVNGDSSIGDTVYTDANEDTDQSGTLEVGRNGIGVVLTDAAGNELARTTTATLGGIDGSYSFGGLIPGTYLVEVDESTLPTTAVTNTPWTVTTDGSAATPISVTLPAATDDDTADIGITARGSIGDQVFIDLDRNGTQAVGEDDYTGAPITIALLDAGGTQITTTTTGPDGSYSFDDLLAGDYQVQVVTGTLPAGFVVTTTDPQAVTLGVGSERIDLDIGIDAPATINGQLYVDTDNSASQGLGETAGLSGVEISLLDPNNANAVIATTTTGPGGTYSFGDLEPGDYVVQVTGTLPAGYSLTTPDTSAPITLSVGDTEDDIDFGANSQGTIGDFVWYDIDGDGMKDPGEPGLIGGSIDLVIDAGLPTENIVDTVLHGGPSSPNYQFTGVNAGDYTVRYDVSTLPTGGVLTTPATVDVSLTLGGAIDTADFGIRGTQSIGDTVYIDVDGDGTEDTGAGSLEIGQAGVDVILSIDGIEVLRTTTGPAGAYSFDNLLPGNYTVTIDPSTLPDPAYTVTTTDPLSVTLPADGTDITNADIGINSVGSVSGTVFTDADENGAQDTAIDNIEPGLGGITVSLVDPNTGNVLNDNDGNPLTVDTNADGSYTISNVPAGDYEVRVEIADLPAGQTLVAPTPNDTPITVDVGEDVTDIDFGANARSSIGDRLWIDSNGDGFQDGTEGDLTAPLGSPVMVELLQDQGAGLVIVDSVTTTDGSYLFDDLLAGDYTVRVDTATLPTGFNLTTPNDVVVDLGVGEALDTADFGANSQGVIGDLVFYDANANGTFDAGEPGLDGVTVVLTPTAGGPATQIDTSNGGGYTFTNLNAGEYTVSLLPASIPAGGTITAPTPTNTFSVTLGVGDAFDTADFAITGTNTIGDMVWFDTNGNGVQDPTELDGVENVGVTLLDVNGDIVATALTGPNGEYTFPNLLDGDYAVVFDATTLPTGTELTTPAASSTISGITVAGGQTVDTADAGVTGTNSIGNRIWFDVDGDGLEDTGPAGTEPGVAGVTLRLLDDMGDPVQINGVDVTAVTNANGEYLFDNVPGGTYTVDVVSGLPADAMTAPVNPLTLTVTDGDDIDDRDIAVTGTSAIGDQVFVDPNADGAQSTGVAGATDETVGVPGVTVELVLDSGAGPVVVATDVTDADGNYDFGDLLASTYTVRVADPTLPTGSTDTTGDVTVVLPAATTDDTADIGVAGNGSIGDTVFVDVDENGTQDTAAGTLEVGESGVTLILTDSVGDEIARTTSGPGGAYLFDNVIPGDYTVAVDPTSLPTPSYAVTTTDPLPVTVADGQAVDTADIGINANGTISGTAFIDADEDGAQAGPLETDKGGVVVILRDANGVEVARTTTDPADGTYSFPNVVAGDYTIDVDPTSVPTGFTVVTTPAPITLPVGGTSAGNDVGVNARGSIGDRIWNDLNGNGIQDAGEGDLTAPLATPITVQLLQDQGAGLVVVDTVTTTDGTYLFDDLLAGDYTVRVDETSLPNGFVLTTPNDVDVTLVVDEDDDTIDLGARNPSSLTGTLFVDADSSGTIEPTETDVLGGVTVDLVNDVGAVVATTTTLADGSYAFDDVAPGDYTVRLDTADLAADHPGYGATLPTAVDVTVGVGDDQAGIDFGANNPSDLSGSVWVDADNDDIRDGSETDPVPNVTDVEVVLLDENGVEIDRTNLDSNGDFTFTDVPAGSYTVEVDESTLPDTPTNYNLTAPNGQAIVVGVDDDQADIDFGVNAVGVIGDTIWLDLDGDGVLDADEPGRIQGVRVQLFEQGTTTPVLGANGLPIEAITDANGEYRLVGIIAGDYTVAIDPTMLPAGTTPTVAGTVDVTIGVAEENLDIDIGVRGNNTIGDTVFFDDNRNGIADPGDDGEGGITLALVDGNGNTVATTVTATDGSYTFTGIPGGTYTVVAPTTDLPVGYVVTTQGAEGNGFPVTVVDGDTIDTVDLGVSAPGSIAGTVFGDQDNGADRDSGEPGLGGITVVLTDSTGGVATTTTNPDGSYRFDDLDVDDYTVAVDPTTIPVGSVITTVQPVPATVTPGAAVTGIDHGVFTPGSLSGVVFVDIDGDGVNDAGEPGQNGVVTVVVTDAAGNEVARVPVGSDGTYAVGDLPAGDYTVTVDPATLPVGAVFTTPSTNTVTVASGGNAPVPDVGIIDTTSIGGTVFVDVDANRNRSADEQGQPGVTVELVDDSGVVVSTTTSGPNGSYVFVGVPAGGYTIRVDATSVPDGFRVTTDPVTITVAAGTPVDSVDHGIVGNGRIGDTIFVDGNGNGVQDSGERGLGGVTLTLRDSAGNVVATVTSAPDGSYAFTDLPPGDYTVSIDAASAPEGFAVTGPTTFDITIGGAGETTILTVDVGFEPTGTIPTTGTDTGSLLLLAAVLAVLGLALFFVGRRRRKDEPVLAAWGPPQV